MRIVAATINIYTQLIYVTLLQIWQSRDFQTNSLITSSLMHNTNYKLFFSDSETKFWFKQVRQIMHGHRLYNTFQNEEYSLAFELTICLYMENYIHEFELPFYINICSCIYVNFITFSTL